MRSFLPRRQVAAGLAATLVATAAFTLTAQAPALAAVLGLESVGAYSAFDSQVYKSVTVTCPPGKQVIGIGFALVGAEGSVVLDDLIPTATTLTVGAGEIVGEGEPADGTTNKWEIFAQALCAFPLPGLQIGSQTSTFAAGDSRSVMAQCPREKQLIGAGASLSKGFGQISIDALDIGDTFVTASGIQDEDGYTGEWSITAYTICADPIPGLTIAEVIGAGDSREINSVPSFCPQFTVALGGGWSGRGTWAGQVYVNSLNRTDDLVAADAHEDANGYDVGGKDSWELSVEAVCVPSDRG